VLEQCVFLSVGWAALGQTIPTRDVASFTWLVVLEENLFDQIH